MIFSKKEHNYLTDGNKHSKEYYMLEFFWGMVILLLIGGGIIFFHWLIF